MAGPLTGAFSLHGGEAGKGVTPEVIRQSLYTESINACGPAALLNCCRFGGEELRAAQRELLGGNDATKLRYVIDRYLKGRRSVVAQGQMRWGFHGVFAEDLAAACGDFLEEQNLGRPSSAFLDRREGERDEAFVRRVHAWMRQSVDDGFPPILSLRSFAVKTREEKQNQPHWEVMHHHFVVVRSVPGEVSDKASGFEVEVIDSASGEICGIHLHVEPNRQPFTVLRGNEVKGEWISGRPFLLVTAPRLTTLRPRNLEWSDRFLITANFLVGRF